LEKVISEREDKIIKKEEDVREFLDRNRKDLEDIKKEQNKNAEILRKINNWNIEIKATEERMKSDIDRIGKLNAVLEESKIYLIHEWWINEETLNSIINKEYDPEQGQTMEDELEEKDIASLKEVNETEVINPEQTPKIPEVIETIPKETTTEEKTS